MPIMSAGVIKLTIPIIDRIHRLKHCVGGEATSSICPSVKGTKSQELLARAHL